jgi:gamma-glutamyltranspeptidase/glutathione hydrolase
MNNYIPPYAANASPRIKFLMRSSEIATDGLNYKFIRLFIICFLCFFLRFAWGTGFSGGRADTSSHAMVVAARPEAVEAGLKMLQQGGNSVDAAVAAAFMIGVVEPYASGLGGGGGMLIYVPEKGGFHYLDYYVQAPSQIDTAFSSERDRGTVKSICVPGTPAGLIYAVENYGRLSLRQVMQPAIDRARNGFVVNDVFYEAVLEKLELILNHPLTVSTYLQESLPYMAGDTIKLPALAGVLEGIAENDRDYFYDGEFTGKVITSVEAQGGVLKKDDFANYQVLIKRPVATEYRGLQIFSAAPPQSGVTLLEILKIVKHIPQQDWKPFEQSASSIHLMAEAIKRADADRYAFLADPRFSEVPLAGLLNRDYALQRFNSIDSTYDNDAGIPPGDPWTFNTPVKVDEPQSEVPEPQHTTHISVIDEDGNMVSLTQTLGFFFGSGFSMDGVIFNSGMTNFSRRGINRAEPNKRPRSTIAPTIILKNSIPFAVLGTPGGGTIFNTMAQLIVRLIDLKQSPLEAVDAPRFSTRSTSRSLTMENRFDQKVIEDLRTQGYDINLTDPYAIYLGGIQLIYHDAEHHYFIGVSDPRRGGVAGGY